MDGESGNKLNQSEFLRIWDVIGSRKKRIRGLLEISKSTLYYLIAENKFPKPIKLSKRISIWSAASVREAIAALTANNKDKTEGKK